MQKTLIKWTPQAIHCYERNCNCKGCIISLSMETPCKMKLLIPSIIKQFGYPIIEDNIEVKE